MNFLNGLKSRLSPVPATWQKAETPLPFLISWNITKRCNLRCAHCYLDAKELEGNDETTTADARRFIDEIASLNPDAMLILTGGEPLLRPDCLDLSRYAEGLGLTVVLGTNGTLLDARTVGELGKNGIKGVGISLDSTAPAFHNRFRGVDNAWERTVEGIKHLKKEGIDFQLQFTVTSGNRADIPGLIGFARKHGARAVNVFFLVCTGRGQNMTDLKPEEYEETLDYLVRAEKEFEREVMVRARCAPHFLRVANKLNPGSSTLRGQTIGCIAGS
ncbi:MAG: radical SAM protein, partial [Deltaproteobacteria bacterium]|nr:radical SAM protein [Deltaproteobacteria bacterium]